MKLFSIKILDPKVLFIDNIPCCIGEINIGKFQETFEMPLEYWTIKDYEKQWADGIERIKKNTQSCLIAAIQDPKKSPLVNLWTMYKINNKIFIQNHLFFVKDLLKCLKTKCLT
jgi:hypothetical protein